MAATPSRDFSTRAAAIAGRRFAGRLEPLPLGIDDDLVDARGRSRGRRAAACRFPPTPSSLLVLGRITPSQKMDLAPLLKTFAQQIAAARDGVRSSW